MPLTHLLDTSVYCQVLRPSPISSCVSRWEALGDDSLAIPAVVVAEIEYGLHLKNSPNLWRQYRTVLQFRLPVLDFDHCVAEVFGRCKSTQKRSGNMVDDFDLAIAATAIINDLTLATLNARHFKLIDGLRWEDWS